MSKRILIVDDEPNVRLSYRAVLEAEGHLVDEANSAPTGLEKLIAGHFDNCSLTVNAVPAFVTLPNKTRHQTK